MKYYLVALFVLFLTACGADTKKNTDEGKSEPLQGQLVDGYPTVNGGFGYSVKPGEVISWHINGRSAKNGFVTINDVLGREVDKVDASIKPQKINNSEPSKNGFGYEITFEYQIPEHLNSGVYYINNNLDYMFVVTPKSSPETLIVIPTNTMNAYSCSGGQGLYPCPDEKQNPGAIPAIPKVSFERPIRSKVKWSWDVIGTMNASLQWIVQELSGNDIGYITDYDLDSSDWIEKSKLIVVLGHSEYWTVKAKDNFEAHLDRGRHGLVLGGNIMWWNARYDGNRLVSYKFKNDDEALGAKTNRMAALKDENPIYLLAANFRFGGYHQNNWDGVSDSNPMRVIAPDSPVFKGTGLSLCDELDFSHNHEFDGVPISGFDEQGYPVPFYRIIKQHKVQILGYTWGYRNGHTLGTIHAAQRSENSGYLIQFASNGAAGFGFSNNTHVQYGQSLRNSFELLLNGQSPFSSDYKELTMKYSLQVPYGGNKSSLPLEVCGLDK